MALVALCLADFDYPLSMNGAEEKNIPLTYVISIFLPIYGKIGKMTNLLILFEYYLNSFFDVKAISIM
jgi:hypothetical protein